MKVIYSKYLPFKGFRAINLFGVIFARNDEPSVDKRIINHERIHTRQMLETLVVGFYVWYVFEWLVRWIICRDRLVAYENISFEREAFDNDRDMNYLKIRKRFAFVKYLRKK